MEVWDVPCLSTNCGQDAHVGQESTPTAGAILTSRKDMLGVFSIAVFRAKVGYGVLTDIQNWYLCKRDHGGCLYISTGFKLDDRKPPVSAAIAYLVNSAVDARGEFDVLPRKGERPWSWEVSPCASPSSGSKDGEDEDRTYKLNEREIGGYRTSPSRTRRGSSNATQNQLQEVPAPDLHLDDRPISTGGWSGCVVGGTLIGCRVAVKLALRNSERAEFATPYRLLILFCIYRLLAVLCTGSAERGGRLPKATEVLGGIRPPLVGFGTTANGQIVFIATGLIDGSPLGPGTVTEEVANAALGLDAVYKCKLLHGGVEARNIMVVLGTQPSVRLVDFGFAKRSFV
uniref:Protein kinase domain-containing protein n=1 Tax=Physcomitrium patens TaxID=3218 RepID=A0A7I4AJR9_PHYPA